MLYSKNKADTACSTCRGSVFFRRSSSFNFFFSAFSATLVSFGLIIRFATANLRVFLVFPMVNSYSLSLSLCFSLRVCVTVIVILFVSEYIYIYVAVCAYNLNRSINQSINRMDTNKGVEYVEGVAVAGVVRLPVTVVGETGRVRSTRTIAAVLLWSMRLVVVKEGSSEHRMENSPLANSEFEVLQTQFEL